MKSVKSFPVGIASVSGTGSPAFRNKSAITRDPPAPGPGGGEDADQSPAGEVERLGMGDFVEDTQDGAATGGQRWGHWVLERVKEHGRPPSHGWSEVRDLAIIGTTGGIIPPTGLQCLADRYASESVVEEATQTP